MTTLILLILLFGDCARCGANLPEGAKFCGECGVQVVTPSTRAREMLRLKRPKIAQAMAEKLLKQNPKDVDALLIRGEAFVQLEKRGQALKDFDKAISLAPLRPETLFVRGRAFLHWAATEVQARKALQDFAQALRLDRSHAGALLGRVDALLLIGRFRVAVGENGLSLFRAALAHLDSALTVRPRDAHLWTRKGQIRLLLNEPNLARADFERAIELSPSAAAETGRSQALLQLKQFQKSLTAADAAVRLDSNNADARIQRGDALFALSRLDEAVIEFTVALTIRPRSHRARMRRGYARLGLNNKIEWRKAVVDFTTLYASRAKDPLVLRARGEAHFKLKSYTAAIADWRRALELRPSLRGLLAPRIEIAKQRRDRP